MSHCADAGFDLRQFNWTTRRCCKRVAEEREGRIVGRHLHEITVGPEVKKGASIPAGDEPIEVLSHVEPQRAARQRPTIFGGFVVLNPKAQQVCCEQTQQFREPLPAPAITSTGDDSFRRLLEGEEPSLVGCPNAREESRAAPEAAFRHQGIPLPVPRSSEKTDSIVIR